MQETVTKDMVRKSELREMRVRQSRIFNLTEGKKIKSVKVQVHDLKVEEGKEYEVRTDYGVPAVCITRVK